MMQALSDGLFVQSKVEVCFKVLHRLMVNARTVRFIRNAIPELIDILEGAYLPLDPIMEVSGGREMTVLPLAIRNEDKKAALMVLGCLSFWSQHARETILGRKVLLRQILKDCMAGTDFSGQIIDFVISLFVSVIQAPNNFPTLSVSFLEVAFKGLEISVADEVIKTALSFLDWIVTRGSQPLQTILKTKSAKYLIPVLALASCPNLEQDYKTFAYNLLRISDDKIYSIFLESADPETKVDKLLKVRYPKALSRKQQLCKVFSKRTVDQCDLQGKSSPAEQATFFTNDHDGTQKSECVTRIITEDTARMKPCRKCSRSRCANTEADPGQFKLCSGCRLAVYCSRDCQKLAWREGHKASCGGAGKKREENKSKTNGER